MNIRERYYFSLVCTFRKTMKNFEVKVNVQKGALRSRIFLTIYVLVSSNLRPQWSTLYILVRVCI